MTDPLYDDEMRAAVVEAYNAGEKIVSIEKRLNIPRASIYWILGQSGAAPSRMRRADRLVGDREQLAHLFELLDAQNKYIHDLEERLRIAEGKADDSE